MGKLFCGLIHFEESEMAEGKDAEHWGTTDNMGLMQQIGAVSG